MTPPAETPLRDLFISYAREDAAAIRLIERGLTGRGKTCWIDAEAGAIPPASEHWAAITDAIERCQAFVYAISPHSLASRYCGDELHHAIARGVRLIPVMLTAERLAEIPAQVKKLDYIFFRRPEELENAIAEIADALEIDVEWEKRRRLFVLRALTWEAERDPSRLLRARELEAALDWARRVPARGQVPALVHGFLAESAAEEERRAAPRARGTSAASRRSSASSTTHPSSRSASRPTASTSCRPAPTARSARAILP